MCRGKECRRVVRLHGDEAVRAFSQDAQCALFGNRLAGKCADYIRRLTGGGRKFELVEPLKFLFKDEVRVVGTALGLPDNMVYRQPFPGPGLGVRCLGAITRERLECVRESDAILREEFAKNGLEGKVWQYFTVVPDFKSVGVKGGKRTFEYPVILRAVNTVDAMTATVEDVPFALLQKITDRITKEVKGVNRVLYDLTPKPCGTIEWE